MVDQAVVVVLAAAGGAERGFVAVDGVVGRLRTSWGGGGGLAGGMYGVDVGYWCGVAWWGWSGSESGRP